MRTIAEIKEGMTDDFMRNETLASAYGFEVGAQFSATFSKVSVENILFYIVASALWVLERLFYEYKQDVETLIENMTPHRGRWYRDKVLAFMKDKALVSETDRYDTDGMTEADIEKARVVKYASVEESEDSSILKIKVAGGTDMERAPLDTDTKAQLTAYLEEVKDAGVRILLVNEPAATFNCEIDIYYDPIIQANAVKSACGDAIDDYIINLPFNGEYTNMALIDRLQEVEGVRIAELKASSTQSAQEQTVSKIDAKCTPVSGYFKTGSVKLNMKAYR